MRPRTEIDGWTQGELALQHAGARPAPRTNGHAPAHENGSKNNGPLRVTTRTKYQPPPSRGRNAGRIVIGGTLAATGVVLAAGGLAMTVTYAHGAF